MIKVSLDNAQKVDITARRNDNFDLNINITDAEGFPVVFQGIGNDGMIGEFPQMTHLMGYSETVKAYRDLLIFTITDDNYDPVLIASDTPLNINWYSYYNLGNYNQNSLRYAQGVARTLSRYAGDNVLLDDDAYGTSAAISQLLDGTLSDPVNLVTHFQSPFFKQSLETLELGEDLNIFDVGTTGYLGNMKAGAYIVTGTIEHTSVNNTRTSPLKISFNQKDFNLPKGTYKYTLRSLNNFRKVNPDAKVPGGYVFRDCATWLYGKIKITEY